MKHLFKNALVLLLVILFSACNSGLSISKRRYNKGYYVHHNKRPDSKSKIARTPVKRIQRPDARQAETTRVASLVKPDIARPSDLVTASAGGVGKSAHNPALSASAGSIAGEMLTNPIRTFSELKDKIAADPAKREALSLLWILIAVLAAVYIVGLLLDSFGAGWVIHILLVVILVLLILWLLRIV